MLTACYDLDHSPPTYDFATFLACAEKHREEIGETSLEVIIAPGRDSGFRRDHLPPRDPAVRQRMLERIVFAMTKLLPSCAGVRMATDEDVADFPVGWTWRSRFAHYGLSRAVPLWREAFAPLQAPGKVEKDEQLVTITLRECSYWPSRNSNRAAWTELARALKAVGWLVVVIPDTETPLAVPGVDADLQASVDLVRRARLYEAAKVNLGVSNGPMWMGPYLGRADFVLFKPLADGAVCADPRYFAECELPVGAQIRPGFRIVWETDSAETLKRETSELFLQPPARRRSRAARRAVSIGG